VPHCVLKLVALCVLFAAGSRAEQAGFAPVSVIPARLKMPEPLLTESITDIDGDEAGELEVDITGMLSRTAGASRWLSALELEWRALPRLGLALEVDLDGPVGAAATGERDLVASVRPAASWVLLHDRAQDLHAMLELSAVAFRSDDSLAEADLGEGLLPVSAGLRAGWRTGPVTFRGFLGAGAGGHSAHALPLRAQVAALLELGAGGGAGFLGVEADADWGRAAPFAVAPNLVLRSPLGFPFDLGLAAPVGLGTGQSSVSGGLLVRLIVED
jgi:hypothetical protein